MKIIVDKYELTSSSDALIVESDQSYIEARNNIFRYKINNKTKVKDIYVTANPYIYWFDDLENEADFSFDRISPIKQISDKYGITLPKELIDEDIIKLKLLDSTGPFDELNILKNEIGDFFLKSEFDPTILSHFATFVIDKNNKLVIPFIRKKWNAKLNQLKNQFSNSLRIICEHLIDCNQDFAKLLSEGIYFSDSKPLLEEWIHDNYSLLKTEYNTDPNELKAFLTTHKTNIDINNKLESIIEKKWTNWLENHIYTIKDMSGNHPGELNALLSMISGINVEHERLIKNKFSTIINDVQIEKLRKEIKPELKQIPDFENFDILDQWQILKNWSISSFFPLKFYHDRNPQKIDIEIIESLSIKYSDWLVENYFHLSKSNEIQNWNIVNEIRDKLDDNRIAIWLIIDCFPSIFVDDLQLILKDHGIYNISCDYKLAPIPTITEIGIPSLISGLFETSQNKSFNRQKVLANSFKTYKVHYENKLAKFKKIFDEELDLYCLHWYEIDELLHKSESEIFESKEAKIEDLLNKIISFLSSKMKEFSDKKPILFISTDHGAAKCLDKNKRIVNPNIEELKSDKIKERCIKLKSIPKKEYLGENEVYLINKSNTSNIEDWIVAKGYNYFGKYDTAYRHGGLSPEETIVPSITCEFIDEQLVPLIIKYVGQEIKENKTQDLKIKIINENNFSILISHIKILEDDNSIFDGNFELDKFSEIKIASKIKIKKQLEIQSKAEINIQITYIISGVQKTETHGIVIPLRKDANIDILDLLK